jgi:hypothetical protein
MAIPENYNETERNVDAYLHTRMVWIGDAVELLGGDRDLDPTTVLEAPMQDPTQARADSEAFKLRETETAGLSEAEITDLYDQKSAKLREIAGRFGIGGEADVLSRADVQINEGGKVWKVEAEDAISAHAKTIIFAGQTVRKLGADEILYTEAKYGPQPQEVSEFAMVRQVAEAHPRFVGLESDEAMPFGYEVTAEHRLITEPTDQLVKIGEIDGKPVMLLRVDSESFVDDEGKTKERFRPDSAAQMLFIAQVLSACGDETSSVGMNTSNTYSSRSIDTVRAGLISGRTFDVGMYGRQTLADIQGKPTPEPTPLNQIPGELRVAYDKLLQLQAELAV